MIELRENLGDVLAITSCGYFDARHYPFAESWWRYQGKSGGILMVSGVHVVDWMRAMCGDVATVRALAAPQADSRYEFPDTLVCVASVPVGCDRIADRLVWLSTAQVS